MCIIPKFSSIYSWSCFHLFLNYLYLVALLNLKVSYAFMFCYSMRDKLKTICYVFPYDLNTCLTFIVLLFMIFCFCSISCYNMVAKFLLSRLCLSCPCFKFFLIPALNAYIDDQDCVSSCHLKNYFFCYHLPNRGRAGVKLGDAWYVQNVSIIFDAPCLFLHHLRSISLYFVVLLCIF
jgi:hypothetical protein